MYRKRSGKERVSGAASTRVGKSWAGNSLNVGVKASELCLTEFARAAFIRHDRECQFSSSESALRVCGKESCFDLSSEQVEKGKLVLQRLILQESDNYLPSHPPPEAPTINQLPNSS